MGSYFYPIACKKHQCSQVEITHFHTPFLHELCWSCANSANNSGRITTSGMLDGGADGEHDGAGFVDI